MEQIKVEIFSSPGCSKCGHTKEILRKMIDDLDTDHISWREVNILNELDYSVEIGVLTTPAIVIDKELVFKGMPSVKKLRSYIDKKLEQIADGK